MKSQKIQEMSNEALLKRKKSTEAATGALAGLLAVGIITALFLWFEKGAGVALPLLVTFLALSPVVWVNRTDLQSVKKELQTRNVAL